MPISKAIQCSTALPIVYKPVDLKGRQMVDGGIRSTTNVDIAVEKGAKFIVVVNPLVPFVNDFEKTIPTVFGTRVRRVSDMGLPAIANQTFRLIAHARLHQAVEMWQERYPGVDIILVEPEPNDELMFGTPIMDYSRRLKIARHGFESVTATLAKDYDRYKEIAERHGLEISGRRVRRVVERAAEEEPSSSAWRRVLEQTTSALLRSVGRGAPSRRSCGRRSPRALLGDSQGDARAATSRAAPASRARLELLAGRDRWLSGECRRRRLHSVQRGVAALSIVAKRCELRVRYQFTRGPPIPRTASSRRAARSPARACWRRPRA